MNCKLTDNAMQTYRGCQWKIGEWKETSGRHGLCSDGWIHYYRHPLLAVLHDPCHGKYSSRFTTAKLFEVDVAGRIKHDGMAKSGCSRLRLTKEMPNPPEITNIQCIAYGIYCALEVWKTPEFIVWANDWLSGANRTIPAANEMWNMALSRPWADAQAACRAITAAMGGNVWWRVAGAAIRAVSIDPHIDLISLAEKAMLIK